MRLEETKQLLQTFHIVPNKLLGQNFMVDDSLYLKLEAYAEINKRNVVVDVGAGFGFLTLHLAAKCKAVFAVEKDHAIAAILRKQVKGFGNVKVVEGDVLCVPLPEFDKVVAIPPYYLSSRLVQWILKRKCQCSVLILQKEFAERLEADLGSESYGWLTVVVSRDMKIELLDPVSKHMFYPQPEVDSVIIRLTRRNEPMFKVGNEEVFMNMVRQLFTDRNKKTRTGLIHFLRKEHRLSKEDARFLALRAPFGDKRARELSAREFGEIYDAIE